MMPYIAIMTRYVAIAIAALGLPETATFAQTLAITHAQAWTMEAQAPVADATIVVVGSRIVSVKAGASPPAGATIIDAAGKPVTPGFMNAATQIGLTEVSSAKDTRDFASSTKQLGAAFDVSLALNPNSTLIALARADGLTRTLAFPGPSAVAPFSGLAATLRLRDGPDILDRSGAALFVVIGGGTWPTEAGSRAAQWGLLQAYFGAVKAGRRSGYGPELNSRDAAVIHRVLDRQIPLAIVTHRESDILQAIHFASTYGIRAVIVGGSEAWRAADALAEAHIPVVLDPIDNLPRTFDQLGARQTSAALLAKAGVVIAFGLVGGPLQENYNAGLALREGAGIAVANGLPYFEALKALTVNPLAIWRRGGPDGVLAPGREADLVIWDGDPLEPATNAVAVIIEGRRVSLETRQDLLGKRYLSAGH